MPRRNLRPVLWWRLSTFEQCIIWKMPNNYEQFIEWQFLEICIVVKHSRWKKLQYKKSRSGSSCHEEIWRTQVLRTLFENAQYLWAIIEWQNNKFRAKPISLKTKIWNVSSFFNWRLHATKKLETSWLMKILNFQQFIVWKMPNNYEEFIEWQF